MDLGANKTLTGGLALQTVETYKYFISKKSSFFILMSISTIQNEQNIILSFLRSTGKKLIISLAIK